MTDAQVGDLVVATYPADWANKTGRSYTITDVVWQRVLPGGSRDPIMVGNHKLSGAVHVDIVERAS